MPVRIKAFIIHVVISIIIFSGAFLLATWLWYPEFYFSANGVWKVVRTVAMVDLALGPLMTLVLFKPGKPGLMFDLTLIAIFQIGALSWGVWVLMSQRPVLTVYDQGIFYCLSPELAQAAQAQPANFADPRIPVAQAYLPPPADSEEQQLRDRLFQHLPPNVPSVPAYVFGRFFQAASPQNLPAMLHDEVVVTEQLLTQYPIVQQNWEAFTNLHPDHAQRFAYFPLSCSPEDHLAAVDKSSGLIVDALPFPSLRAYKKRTWQQIQSR